MTACPTRDLNAVFLRSQAGVLFFRQFDIGVPGALEKASSMSDLGFGGFTKLLIDVNVAAVELNYQDDPISSS
jgi:hypothetical protein